MKNNSVSNTSLLQRFESRRLTSSVLLLFLLVLQAYYIKFGGWDGVFAFGPEWRNIPSSILSGNGFSDPFGCSSGITAWMVPGSFIPVVFVFALFGVTKISFLVLAIFRIVSIVFSFNLFLKSKWFNKKWYNHLAFLLLFLLYIFLSPNEFFKKFDDLWLNFVFSFLFLFYFSEFLDSGKRILPLAILAFFLPLTIPGMALPFVAVIFASFIVYLFQLKDDRKLVLAQSNKIVFIHYFILGASFLLAVGAWSIRNYTVFDKFIPVKSNAAFEFYISNIVDKDGIHSYSTWYEVHPGSNKKVCNSMGELGEQGWLEGYKEMEEEYLKNYKDEYRRKILNRAKNAFLFTINEQDFFESKYFQKLPQEEQKKLIDAELIKEMRGYYYWWFCLDLEENVFVNKLNELNIKNDGLIADWQRAVKKYKIFPVKQFPVDSGIAKGLLSSGIPFFCLILLIFLKGTYKRELFYLLVFYTLYVVPYVVISHQLRYQKPLIVIQAFILFLLFTKFINRIKKNKSSIVN